MENIFSESLSMVRNKIHVLAGNRYEDFEKQVRIKKEKIAKAEVAKLNKKYPNGKGVGKWIIGHCGEPYFKTTVKKLPKSKDDKYPVDTQYEAFSARLEVLKLRASILGTREDYQSIDDRSCLAEDIQELFTEVSDFL